MIKDSKKNFLSELLMVFFAAAFHK